MTLYIFCSSRLFHENVISPLNCSCEHLLFLILYPCIACPHPISLNSPPGSPILVTTHYTPIITFIIDKLYGHFAIVRRTPIIASAVAATTAAAATAVAATAANARHLRVIP